jgi:DNA-binding NarL/FixJ family response regulator
MNCYIVRMLRILVADDHPLMRTALRQAVAVALTDARVDEVNDLTSLVARLGAEPDTDLVLLDLHMPDSRGLAGLVALRAQFPGVAVLVVSAYDDATTVRRALDYGAAGFIPKSAPPEELGAAIKTILACGRYVPPLMSARVAQTRSQADDTALAARLARLTGQQYRVLSLIAEGKLNKQIADALGIQERTVKAHTGAIFDRLGVRNRTQAGVLLQRLDLAASALDGARS